MMSPTENLYYAIGEIAYAVARADGDVQKEERVKFHSIVEAGLRSNDNSYNVSDIIFQILDKDKTSTKDAYDWAIKEIRLNSHYLSPELKAAAIKVVEKIAQAFPPVTKQETDLIQKFKSDIETLKGDPIFYKKLNL